MFFSTRTAKAFVPFLVMSALFTVGCSDDETSTPAPGSPSTPGASSGAPAPSNPGSSSDPMAQKDIVDTAVGAGSFKTLVSAVQGAGLESTLRSTGPFTVFAPTDDAFAKIPGFLLTKLVSAPYKTELGLILKYHVIGGKAVRAADVLGKKQDVATASGGNITVDGSSNKVVVNGIANVTKADVTATNGVIHVIDNVMLPTIVDTAVGYDDGTTKFSTLVAAVKAAGLVETLSGPGPFTVFAPTDKAFEDLKAALGEATFNAVLADKAKLTKILGYHVLSSAVYSKDVAAGDVGTVEGSKIAVGVSGGNVTLTDSTPNAANVVFTDLPNSNGVIHVIDKVLLPPNL